MSLVILNLDHKNEEIDSVLKNYGLTEYTDKVRKPHLTKFYKRIIDTNVLKDNGVSYACLNEEALQKGWAIDLKKQGILSFLRIDNGHLDAGLPKTIDINNKIKAAKDHQLVGLKLRVYIDNIDALSMALGNLINYAYLAKKEKLLMICEIIVKKEWQDKAERELELFNTIFDKWHKILFNNILIFSVPENPGIFDDMNRFEVVKVVAGSDYELSLDEYVEKIKGNNMVYSVSDSVFKGLKVQLSDQQFKNVMAANLSQLGK